MTGKPIQPPSAHPDDEPLVSVCINEQWIPYLIGMVYPARYPEYWGGTLEENRTARKDVMTLLSMLQATQECDDMKDCCVDPVIIYKVDPTTGQVVQSTDNGTTWNPSGQNLSSVIVVPVPPVTSGVASTKCDAAKNVALQIDEWITHVEDDFDTATTLLEFGIAVCEAILAAVLVVLSAGALTPIEALILPTLGAALAAAWGAGKVVFTDYWTDAIKEKILCAIYTNIGEDGSFTDAQFSAMWNGINTTIPPSPAKMLFMGFLSSSGTAGLNAMAASGQSSGFDCSTLHCNDTWCYDVDLTLRDFHELLSSYEPTSNPAVYNTVWTSGVGWQTANGDPNYTGLIFAMATVPGIRYFKYFSAGADLYFMGQTETEHGDSTGTSYEVRERFFDGTETYSFVIFGERSRGIITRVHLEGVGENPFGADNC